MSERFDLLKPTLDKYERRFTVLDLGAGINHPTLGFEITQSYDVVVVEVEKDWHPINTGPHTIVLQHVFKVADLQLLSECEHFDVVLAFNIVHWFGVEWRAALDVILGLGDYVFVQVPTDEDMDSAMFQDAWPQTWSQVPLMNSLLREEAEWVGKTSQFPGHAPRPIYRRGNGVKRLTRTNWEAHPGSADTVIYSTHKDIQGSFHHKTPREHRPWVPGINLWNVCHWGGVVPARAQVLDMMADLPLPAKRHGDIQPWNMILDGERLHLIDGGDAWGGDDREGMAQAVRRVEECLTT